MAQTWILSDSYKLGGIDLTASPQAIFTVNSTYTTASNLVTVEADETSGGGYARPNLTVQSNAINSDGYGEINYVQFSLTASGGNITYDRIALAADSDWVAYANFGTTQTLTSGNTATFEITFTNGESGATITGSDGQSAFTTATFGFTQPAVDGTVAVTVGNSDWLVVGAYCAFSDGANLGFYEVTAIGSATAVTLKNLGYLGVAAPSTAMAAGGLFVPTGAKGETSASGGGGSHFEFTADLGVGTVVGPAPGEIEADGSTNGGLDPITELYLSETDNGGIDVSAALANITQNATVILRGGTSGVTAYYRLDTALDSGTYHTWGVTLLDADGDFSNTEEIFVQVVNTAIPLHLGESVSFTASTVTPGRYFIDASAANVTVTLPAAAAAPLICHLFKRVDDGAGGFSLTLSRSGSDLIDGETSQTLQAYESISLHSDGVSNWWIS